MLSNLPPGTSSENDIFLPKVNQFYKHFRAGVAWLGLKNHGFLPYSLRRGGATAFFRATRSMEATLDRGRWASARVARIYVNDGLAREVEIEISSDIRHQLQKYAKSLLLWADSV